MEILSNMPLPLKSLKYLIFLPDTMGYAFSIGEHLAKVARLSDRKQKSVLRTE